MQTTFTDGIAVPDPDAIRARINQLCEEANNLRKLLRAVNRLRETRSGPATMPPVAHASIRTSR